MEPEDSLPSSQELSTCTYPEPDQSSPPSTPNHDNIDYVLRQARIRILGLLEESFNWQLLHAKARRKCSANLQLTSNRGKFFEISGKFAVDLV
jgi:hypothetical protein